MQVWGAHLGLLALVAHVSTVMRMAISCSSHLSASCVLPKVLPLGNRQGDAQHPSIADWTPLLNTPPHPEYPSTHSVTAGASGEVLARYTSHAMLLKRTPFHGNDGIDD